MPRKEDFRLRTGGTRRGWRAVLRVSCPQELQEEAPAEPSQPPGARPPPRKGPGRHANPRSPPGPPSLVFWMQLILTNILL